MSTLLLLATLFTVFGLINGWVRVRTALVIVAIALLLPIVAPALLDVMSGAGLRSSTGESAVTDFLIRFKQYLLLLTALGVAAGIVGTRRGLRRALLLVAMPVVLVLGHRAVSLWWEELTVVQAISVFVLGVPALIVALLLFSRFGREVLAAIIGHFIYDRRGAVARAVPWFLLLGSTLGLLMLLGF